MTDKLDMSGFFVDEPVYPVVLENGYQILKPLNLWEYDATGKRIGSVMQLRLYAPQLDKMAVYNVAGSFLQRVDTLTALKLVEQKLHMMADELAQLTPKEQLS